jgi:hypothetical protein
VRDQGGDEQQDGERGGDRGHRDARGQMAAAQQHVADRPAGDDPDDSADADHEQQQVREHLADPVLAGDEFGPERLDAGHEVVAAGARDDQRDVRPHRQDVPDGAQDRHGPARLASEALVRLDAHRRGDVLRLDRLGRGRGCPVARGAVVRRARFGRQCALAAADRFGQPEHQPGQDERGQREDDERRPPGQCGDVAGEGEPGAGAEQFPGQDVTVDLAPFRGREPVTGQGSGHRAGRRGDGAEQQPGQEQVAEGRHRGAPQHRHAPDQ